jgi:hypothetical protein
MYAESEKRSPEQGRESPASRTGSPSEIILPLGEPLRWKAPGETDDLALRLGHRQTPDKLLFHYYLNRVGGTFASIHSDPDLARMWQTGVPSVAFAYRGASHAIMAVSALCMGLREEHAGAMYDHQATAELHYDQAVKDLRTSMAALDQANIDAVLACCMTLVPCSLAMAALTKGAALLGDWILHTRGFATLGDSLTGSDAGKDSIPSLPSSESLVVYPQPSNPGLDMAVRYPADNSQQTSRVLLLRSIHQSAQRPMENLRRGLDPQWSMLSGEDVQACLIALEELRAVFDYALQGRAANYSRAVLRWLVMIPARFVQLLFDEAEAALAIFTQWLVTTLVLDDMWWMKGFGSSRIQAIAKLFERSGSVYLSCMEWPLEALRRLEGDGRRW